MSARACLGILRRAEKRGKSLPPELDAALRAQASSSTRGGQTRSLGEEDEQSPTLTAGWHNPAVYSMTGTQEHASVDENLTGTQTARQFKDAGIVAFAQNTRDEVRYQGDGELSGALAANPGMKQTTYVCETAHGGSNGLGVGESSVYPTLDTTAPPERGSDARGGCLNPADPQSKRVYSPFVVAPTLSSGTREGMNIQPSVLVS